MATKPVAMSKEDLIEFAKKNVGKECQGRYVYMEGCPVIKGRLVGYRAHNGDLLIEPDHGSELTEEQKDIELDDTYVYLCEPRKNVWFVDCDVAVCMTDEERTKLKEQLARDLLSWEP